MQQKYSLSLQHITKERQKGVGRNGRSELKGFVRVVGESGVHGLKRDHLVTSGGEHGSRLGLRHMGE